MINDVLDYFQTRKGLRQGDVFSPLLFDIAVDVLAVLAERTQQNELIRGLVADLLDDG
jgi:hypothetical protein